MRFAKIMHDNTILCVGTFDFSNDLFTGKKYIVVHLNHWLFDVSDVSVIGI